MPLLVSVRRSPTYPQSFAATKGTTSAVRTTKQGFPQPMSPHPSRKPSSGVKQAAEKLWLLKGTGLKPRRENSTDKTQSRRGRLKVRLVQISFFRLCPSTSTRAKVSHRSLNLSSRAKPWRDLWCAFRPQPLLKTLHPNNQRRGPPTSLNLVIPSEAEGPVVRLSAATTLKNPPSQ